MSTYRSDREALEARAEKERQAAADAQALYQFFQKHRELLSCEANYSILRSYFNGEPMSLEALEEAILNPALSGQLAFTTEERTKSKLVEKIMALYVGSSAAKEAFAKKLKYDDIETLEGKLAEIESRRDLQQKNASELRQIIRDNAPTPEQSELPAEWTRARILSLDGPGIRKLIDRWTAAAVTRRLNDRSNERGA